MSLETPTNYRSMNLNSSSLSSGGAMDDQFHLPKITHPSTRISDPHSINVNARAVSRQSSLGELADKMRPTENGTFRKSKRYEQSSGEYNIPEGVRAIYTPDVNKVSMPIFGSRPGSSASSTASMSLNRVDIDEYLHLLREKVKSNFHETRTRFRNADQDGKGGLSKEAFAHLIASILGPSKPLSHQHFVKLIEKLGLKNRPIIKYEDFINCFQDSKNEISDWIDPVRSTTGFQTPINRKATQVFVILKEKSNLKTADMVGFIPSLNGGQPNKVFKPELLNLLNGMAIKMDPEEFDKLWKKFDPENTGFVKSDLFMKRLGLRGDSLNDSFNADSSFNGDDLDIPSANVSDFNGVNKYKVRKLSRKNTNPIEKWLKKQFRNGFSKIKSTFEEMDVHQTGLVRRDQFLNVLRQHGFKLETNLLDAFMERCDMHTAKNSSLISYTEFLEKFQNRSDQGLAYRLIAGGSNLDDSENSSNIGQVERRLLKLFQNDFLSLLQIFRKIDRTKSNMISKQEFRAAIESHFAIELTDVEFEEFLTSVPKDGNKIKYLEFMTRFDSDSSSTLFDSDSVNNDDFAPRFKKYETITEENENETSPRHIKGYNGRRKEELKEIIKDKIKNHYKEVETAWDEVDSHNTKAMSKDMMWHLFKKLKVEPQFTRDEIDLLWSDFILKDNKKLEYWQFVRHFGYSKKSAAFTNAKRAPPQRGDNDMMLTSNKLGRDSILIRGSVQAKLLLQFDILKRSYQEIDPYFTNFVLRDEFEETLRELCPELNRQEMEYICSKHESPSDPSKINYMEFLEPYAPKRNREKPSDSLKEAQEGDLPSSRLDMNDTLVLKLRIKLGENYKPLRRVFKQHDPKQTGFVNITGFREALQSTKVNLNEEDMYSLMRKLDKNVTGMINYNKFINEVLKN